jgi:Holliday junction resolvasome RuvABC ATP-dependent DNA helicase subunit
LYQRQREQEKRDDQNNHNNTTSGYINKNETKQNKDAGGTNSSDKRPEENVRVILLSGPPGVGKRTQIMINSQKPTE